MMSYSLKNIHFIPVILLLLHCSAPAEFITGSKSKLSDDKSFTSFVIEKKYNPGLSRDFHASVNNSEKTIAAVIRQTLPADLKNIRPTFSFEGSYVMTGRSVVQSTVSVNDFTNPVTYRLYAEDGSSADYSAVITFGSTYQYKPEAFGINIIGRPIPGKKLLPEYTYLDRNSDREKRTVIKWLVETGKYTGVYDTAATFYMSNSEIDSSGEITAKAEAAFTVPSGKTGCRVKLQISPNSELNTAEFPTMTVDDTAGYTVELVSPYAVRADTPWAGVVINEIQTAAPALDIDGNTYTNIHDEFIALYNTTDSDIDIAGLSVQVYNGTGWDTWCDLAADETFLNKPPPRMVGGTPVPFAVKTIIKSKGFYLLTRPQAPSLIKRRADIIVDPAVFFPASSGAVQIIGTDSGALVDLVGWGGALAPIYEGPGGLGGADPSLPGESMRRKNYVDIDNNRTDFAIRQSSSPTGSDTNIITAEEYPPIVTGVTIVKVDPDLDAEDPETDNYFRVSWTYHDWQFNPERVKIHWRVHRKSGDNFPEITDSQVEPYLVYDSNGNPMEAPFPENPVSNLSYSFTLRDHYRIPAGVAPYVSVEVVPIIQEGSETETEVCDEYNVCHTEIVVLPEITGLGASAFYQENYEPAAIAPVYPARLKITRILPEQNMVEVYSERGGTLGDLRISIMESNEIKGEDIVFKTFSHENTWSNNYFRLSLTQTTMVSGKHRIIQTKETDNEDWNNYSKFLSSNQDGEPYQLINGSNAYNGVIFEIVRHTGTLIVEDEPVDQYMTQDAFVYSVGKPGELLPHIKRNILLSNKSGLASANAAIHWYVPGLTESWYMSSNFLDAPRLCTVEDCEAVQEGEDCWCTPGEYVMPAPAIDEVADLVSGNSVYFQIAADVANYPLFRISNNDNRYIHDNRSDNIFNYLGAMDYIINGAYYRVAAADNFAVTPSPGPTGVDDPAPELTAWPDEVFEEDCDEPVSDVKIFDEGGDITGSSIELISGSKKTLSLTIAPSCTERMDEITDIIWSTDSAEISSVTDYGMKGYLEVNGLGDIEISAELFFVDPLVVPPGEAEYSVKVVFSVTVLPLPVTERYICAEPGSGSTGTYAFFTEPCSENLTVARLTNNYQKILTYAPVDTQLPPAHPGNILIQRKRVWNTEISNWVLVDTNRKDDFELNPDFRDDEPDNFEIRL
jgi:hypothetical protein